MSKFRPFFFAACFFLFLGCQPVRNRYEAAQRQTVLLTLENCQGSGVVVRRVNKSGYSRWFIFTAAHVVRGTNSIKAVVIHRTEGHKAGRTEYKARRIFSNPALDFALLQVDAPADAFIPAEFATLPSRVGDPIFATGNFLGEDFDGSVSTGVISQVGIFPGEITGWPWPLLDQTTAPVYPGSSGGPIFNSKNEVLGLVVGGIGATLNGYVPVRVIETWARNSGFRWAVRGNRCPTDEALEALTKLCE